MFSYASLCKNSFYIYYETFLIYVLKFLDLFICFVPHQKNRSTRCAKYILDTLNLQEYNYCTTTKFFDKSYSNR